MKLVAISRELSTAVDALPFALPVTHVYNPLAYARAPHEAYLKRYGSGSKSVLLLGMNPGPFGMGQTGVPFGDVAQVRDWLGVSGRVGKPQHEHPKRPVLGFDCPRSEVSGTRLWSWAAARYPNADDFFAKAFVANYCPLLFMEESGKNRTPDKLSPREREALYGVCDEALRKLVEQLGSHVVVGVGGFAQKRAREALDGLGVEIAPLLHPSPANPRANRGWAQEATQALTPWGL